MWAYIAGPLFNEMEREYLERIDAICKKVGIDRIGRILLKKLYFQLFFLYLTTVLLKKNFIYYFFSSGCLFFKIFIETNF